MFFCSTAAVHDACGLIGWWMAIPLFFQAAVGVAALWVMAVRVIAVRSVFCQYTGPADKGFCPLVLQRTTSIISRAHSNQDLIWCV